MEDLKKDIKDRAKIWDAMQMLYMDTDIESELDYIAKACAPSKYSINELKSILFNEVFPACRFNMTMFPAPEWCGFELSWLSERILIKQRHGKRKLLFLRYYTYRWWKKLSAKIINLRNSTSYKDTN